MQMPERGFVYVAVGERYLAEAEQSVRSLRRHCPDAHVTLYAPTGGDPTLFDDIRRPAPGEYNRITKISVLVRSPYERTVFLDTDTYICRDPSELFDALERFELAASHAAQEIFTPDRRVPESFIELNSGVIAFKRGPAVARLADLWLEDYRRQQRPDGQEQPPDQTAFRYALWASDVRVATLPTRYNCRLPTPGIVMAPVSILHGRVADFGRLERTFNGRLEKGRRWTRKFHMEWRGHLIVLTLKIPDRRKLRWRIRGMWRKWTDVATFKRLARSRV